jgi:uncharacterized repeat protein (TIGR01451 family)
MAGDTVTFNIRVFNQGTIDANNVIVTDYIPAGLTFVSSTAPVVGNTASEVTLDFGTILAGAGKTLRVTFTIDA